MYQLYCRTSGSGLFDNPEVLVTTYTPSLEDIEDSEVILTLTAQPLTPCQIEATDELILKSVIHALMQL